ncbi:MAG: hypothetical protein GY822_14705 [Deltaproteobacteria bacterium]|nr:hypothetical protein [Deltaproteobacteria bacterium]
MQKRFVSLSKGLSMATVVLSLATGIAMGTTACAPTGEYDGGIGPETDPSSPPILTADDIGTRCVYDYELQGNPTNDCAIGLTCLIITRDYGLDGVRGYAPFQAGDAANFQLPLWENQFTYYRPDGKDEGYCTLVQTQTSTPLTCPAGTTAKALWPNMVVCVKNCTQAIECNREGYTCDLRFLDVSSAGGNHCVRKCTNDQPDCVRTGWFSVDDNVSAYLAVQDLQGASSCDLTSGQCINIPENGTAGPGERCYSNTDCIGGQICLNGGMIGRSDQTGGACGQPCIPVANPQNAQQIQATCFDGYVCQPGIKGGHNPYNVIDLDNGAVAALGGYCFPQCATTNGNCSAHQGTSCGQTRAEVFGEPWNGVSMCLVSELRAGN